MANWWMAATKVLLEMEGRGVYQDLIPNAGLLELTYVPINRWIIDPDMHDLLDGPGDVVCLPTHCGEIVQTNAMTTDVTMDINGGRGPEMFLEPVSKKSLLIQLCTPPHNPYGHT